MANTNECASLALTLTPILSVIPLLGHPCATNQPKCEDPGNLAENERHPRWDPNRNPDRNPKSPTLILLFTGETLWAGGELGSHTQEVIQSGLGSEPRHRVVNWVKKDRKGYCQAGAGARGAQVLASKAGADGVLNA